MAHADGINNRDHNGDMAEEEDGLLYVWLRRMIPSQGLLLYYTLNWLLEDRLYTVMCRALRAWDTIGFSTGWIGPICPRPACTCVRKRGGTDSPSTKTSHRVIWRGGGEIKRMSCLHCFKVDGKKFNVQLCHPAQKTPSYRAQELYCPWCLVLFSYMFTAVRKKCKIYRAYVNTAGYSGGTAGRTYRALSVSEWRIVTLMASQFWLEASTRSWQQG